jgi:hypothetical protein
MQASFNTSHGLMLGSMKSTPRSPDKVHKKFSSAMSDAGNSRTAYNPSNFWRIVNRCVEWEYVEISNGIEMSLTDAGAKRLEFFTKEIQ